MELKSGRFRSTLSTLPADDFPTFDESEPNMTVEAVSKEFKLLLDKTSFAMAHQDVRFFLNGMLIESGQNFLRAVATDGHRLALSNIQQAGLNEKEVQGSTVGMHLAQCEHFGQLPGTTDGLI